MYTKFRFVGIYMELRNLEKKQSQLNYQNTIETCPQNIIILQAR